MGTNSDIVDFIDIEDGVKRVGGNMGLYKKLLLRFIDGKYYEAIETNAQAGETEAARACTHTLKGVSANLSLSRVSVLALELETCFKDGKDHKSALNALREAYIATVGHIATLG